METKWKAPRWTDGEHQLFDENGRLIATARPIGELFESHLCIERPYTDLGQYDSLNNAKAAVARALIGKEG